MIRDPASPIVILSPHLDDAVLSCFHILEAAVPVQVVNVFAGVPEPGTPTDIWGRLCGFDDAHEFGEARVREDAAALALLRREAIYLGFPENAVRSKIDEPLPRVSRLVEEIDRAIPYASLILAPLGGSDRPNVDHRLVRSVAIEFLRRGFPAALYADFPHVCKARHAWPVELVSFERAADALANGVDVTVDSTARWPKKLPGSVPEIDPLYDPQVWVLAETQRVRKRIVMGTYATQFDALDKKLRSKGLVSDPSLYGVEVAVPLIAR